MKYFKTAVLLLLLVFLFSLMSCIEGDPEATPTELLTGGRDNGKTWRITSINDQDPETCVGDNPITYIPDGRYQVNEGTMKCSPSDPPSYVGTWKLNLNQTRITIQLDDSSRNWTIVQLKENVHRLSSEFPDGQRTYTLEPY